MKAPSSSLSSSRKPQQSYPHFLLKKTSSSKTRKIPLVFSLSSPQALRKLLLLPQAPSLSVFLSLKISPPESHLFSLSSQHPSSTQNISNGLLSKNAPPCSCLCPSTTCSFCRFLLARCQSLIGFQKHCSDSMIANQGSTRGLLEMLHLAK